jgi:hypothetical protein
LSSFGFENKIKTSVKIKNGTFYIDNNLFYQKVRIANTTGTLLLDSDITNAKTFSKKFDTKNNKIFIVQLIDQGGNKENLKVFDKKIYNSSTTGFKCGIFDESTNKMVMLYQKNNNLTPDGVIGSKTLNSLLNKIKSVNFKIKERCGVDVKKEAKPMVMEKVVETVYYSDEEINSMDDKTLREHMSDTLRNDYDEIVDFLQQPTYTDQQIDSLKQIKN